MEAFSFCCHVYGVGKFFGSNRPFKIIWCVFSNCLEDGLSLSRNGICCGPGGVYHRLYSLVASKFLVE